MKRMALLTLIVSLVFLVFSYNILPGSQISNTTIWILAALFETLGLETKVVAPERPSTVPETAVWAGGVDGGAWFECSLNIKKNANWCTIWSDQTGDLWARTHFVLQDSGQPVSNSELDYSSFDGTDIQLVDGRLLVPLVLYDKPADLWLSVPIDSKDQGPNP